MPNCTQETANHKIEFGRLGRRVVEGHFDGGSMTSDACDPYSERNSHSYGCQRRRYSVR